MNVNTIGKNVHFSSFRPHPTLYGHHQISLQAAKPKKCSEVLELAGSGQCFGKMSLVSSFQTLSYNRHNLTADTSERQAKEILIRRRHSLRESVRKDSSLNREHRVRPFTPLGRGRLLQQSPQPSPGAGDGTGRWGAGPQSPGMGPMVTPFQGFLRHLSCSRRCPGTWNTLV